MGFMDIFKNLGNVAQKAGPIVSLFNPGVGSAMTFGGSLASRGPSLAGGVPSGTVLSPMQLSQQNARREGSVFDLFNNNKSQIGSALLGFGLNKSTPKVPALPQSFEDLRSKVNSGGSPLRQQATGQLSSMMNEQYNPLSQPEIEASLRQLELDQKTSEDQVRDLYRNIRPGTDPSSDSSFRRDLGEVQDRFARAKADQLATRTRDTKSIFDNQRMAQIQQSLGADDNQMNQLAQLAQQDINQIMTQLQMDYASALNFKEVFQSLGGQLLLSGTDSASPFANFGV